MMYLVSHIEGRTRLKFSDLHEKNSFIKNMRNISGLKELESNGNTLTVLVKYAPDSPFGYIIGNMISKEPEPKLSKDDISSYVAPLLTNPITKAVWLMGVLGAKVGFLQFGISSMIVNKYIKAKFR
jgi:hypothetical protein